MNTPHPPRHTTHRNAVAEVRIVDQRTVIKYKHGGVCEPVEEYPTHTAALAECFRWLREQEYKSDIVLNGPEPYGRIQP